MKDRLHVLIVDDNPDDRALVLREVFALYPDAMVVEAGTHEEFEQALVREPCGLVVTDLDLKWGSGRDVLQEVRKRHPNCPVIMFTGSGNEMTAVDLMKAGLSDYIVKSTRQLPRLRTSLKLAVEHSLVRHAMTAREAELAAALQHEKTVVRELHHRVKNNLQIIASLLELRARNSTGEDAPTQLLELAGRMRALGAVQARIYQTESLDRVDFRTVLGDLAESLIQIGGEGNIGLTRSFDGPLSLEVARAMPLGLLVYEFMLNAIKHAWPAGAHGMLTVELKTLDPPTRIIIADDGMGYVSGTVEPGLGSRIGMALAGEARVEVDSHTGPGEGTRVVLTLL